MYLIKYMPYPTYGISHHPMIFSMEHIDIESYINQQSD